MSLELLLPLIGLALLDSLSIGTLLIPLFFLLAPRLRVGRVLLYLAAIATFYLAAGVALLSGALSALGWVQDALDSPAGLIAQFAVGAAMLVGSFLVPTSSKSRTPVAAAAGGGAVGGSAADDPAESAPARPGRLTRWRERALEGPSAAGVVGVAVAAGLLELATMLPYLGAIGLLTTADLDVASRFALLAGYCAVMVLPALLLLALRILARPLVERPLARLAAWLERTGPETTAWIVGIVGFLLLRDAASRLEFFQQILGG